MVKVILLFGLFSTSFSLHGCKTANADNLNTRNEQPIAQTESDIPTTADETAQKTEKTNATSQTVNFKGISFKYNPQISGEVKMEEVSEQPLKNETDKPDGVAPQHFLFTLEKPDSTKFQESDFSRKTEIYIFPINDYRRMYAVSNEVTERFDNELKGLKMVRNDKNFRLKNQIPFIPSWDGSQTFQSKVKNFAFQNGKGIFFLTQFDIETSLINNGNLTYCFEGVTNDEKYYILAEFSVKAPFLPKIAYVEKFEDYQIPKQSWNMNKNEVKQYKNYISKITKRLENLPSDKYEPNLKYFEDVISSLKIGK